MAGITGPSSKQGQSISDSKLIALATRIKTLIVTMALWGLIPYKVADCLIRWMGLRNA